MVCRLNPKLKMMPPEGWLQLPRALAMLTVVAWELPSIWEPANAPTVALPKTWGFL